LVLNLLALYAIVLGTNSLNRADVPLNYKQANLGGMSLEIHRSPTNFICPIVLHSSGFDHNQLPSHG